ncbi:O-antigen ligase family protein [Flavobacterium sp. RS13.1]|uniref:O-antigen ligase family protein n=1 Tax=Flavobacterium sp. RS13.1 TaxID=3400345 RepID=UPI003AB023C7
MINLKMTSMLLRISRLLLVVFVVILLLFIPQLHFPEYVLPTITSKTIYFLYGSIILCGLYTLTIVFSKEITFSFSKIDIVLFVLVLYITLNRYFIQSYYGFSIRYIELLGLSFFYVVLRSISLKNYPWILLSVVISGIIQTIYGNLQLFGYYASNHSGFKMTGSFFNPGPYAGFLASVWSVALGMYLFKDEITASIQVQKKRNFLLLNEAIKNIFEYIPLLGIISIAIVLPALQSRASWIATIVSSAVLIELKYHFLKNILKRAFASFQIKAVITISIIILSITLFSLYHYKKASSDGRVFIWKLTTYIITDNPVFGVGFDRFKAYYMNYQADYFAENGETLEALVADNVYYAFNEGLQFVSENGLIGLVLLLILIYTLFRAKINEEYYTMFFIGKTGLLTIGIFACFSYPMQILPIKLVLVFLLALLTNSVANEFQLNIGYSNRSLWLYKTAVLLVTFVTTYQTISYTNNLSQGFIAWNIALISHQYGNYESAIIDYELAYPILKSDGDFLMNYGKTLSIAKEYSKAIEVLKQSKKYQNNTIITNSLGDSYVATKQFDKAEVTYKRAINMTPSKFYANYLLAKLYDLSGQEEKAVTMSYKILNKKIKIPSTAIKEIQIEMKKILIKYKNPPEFKN